MGKLHLTACAWLLATACGRTDLSPAAGGDAGAASNAVAVGVDPGLACVARGSRLGVRVSITRASSSPAAEVVVTADGAPDGVVAEPLTIPASRSSGLLWIDVADGASPTTVTLGVRAGDVSSALELTVGAPFGSVDGSFERDGPPTTTPNALVAVQGDSIVAGMTSAIPPDDVSGAKTWLVRIGPDWRLDHGFGAPPYGVASVDTSVTSLATTSDGSVLLGTALAWGSSQGCSHARILTRDGAPMQLLGAPATYCGGKAITTTIFEAPDHAIYACGSLWSCCGFAERHREGSLDTSFGDGGAVGENPYVNTLYDCALGADGHLAMALYEGVEDVDANGALVFDRASHSQIYGAATFSAVAVGDDGTIYAAGMSGTKPIVRALSPDGSLAPGFAQGGEALLTDAPRAMFARHDGLVVLTDTGLFRMGFDGATRAIATFPKSTVAMAKDACGRIVTATYAPGPIVPSLTVRRYWP